MKEKVIQLCPTEQGGDKLVLALTNLGNIYVIGSEELPADSPKEWNPCISPLDKIND